MDSKVIHPESDTSQLDFAQVKVVSVRELARDTARVLEELNSSDTPVVITRHGRFVALLAPLEHKVQSILHTSAPPRWMDHLDDGDATGGIAAGKRITNDDLA